MMKKLFLALAFALVVTAAPALAGPPLICGPIDIGKAQSLPWSSAPGWNGALASYDLTHLGDDTVSLLTPQTPVNVRRETLRRAAIYAAGQTGLAESLAAPPHRSRRRGRRRREQPGGVVRRRLFRRDDPSSRADRTHAAPRTAHRLEAQRGSHARGRTRPHRESDSDGRPRHATGGRSRRGSQNAGRSIARPANRSSRSGR